MRSVDEIVAHAAKVQGYMHEPELRWLCEQARSLTAPAAWCEIGCWQGRSATAVAGGLPPPSQLLLVDNFSGPTTREMPNQAACRQRIEAAMTAMRIFAPGIEVSLAVGDSATLAAPYPDGTFDVVFIDGDHKYEKVVADIRSWRAKLKAGGLLCGHDFTNKCGVEPAVRELLPQFAQVPETSLWYARLS